MSIAIIVLVILYFIFPRSSYARVVNQVIIEPMVDVAIVVWKPIKILWGTGLILAIAAATYNIVTSD